MEHLFAAFEYEWASRAFIASGLVGVLCGLLGCFIFLRNMALIGDALSHAILPGVVVGFIIAGHSVIAFFTGSVIAGLITAFLITWIQQNVKSKEDAAIGIVFTSMFALGVMGISWVSRQEGVHLDMKDFLFGNVLGIADSDLILTASITVYVIACIILFYRYLFVTTFQPIIAQTMGISVSAVHYFLMLLLSFSVVASLQSVGVILVIAMLIIPASTAFLLANRLSGMLLIAALVGLISTIGGMTVAVLIETTPGPAMTVIGAFIYGCAVFVSPKNGIIFKYLRKRKIKSRVLEEDVLKAVHHKSPLKSTLESVASQTGQDQSTLKPVLNKLYKKGLITQLEINNIRLTEKGEQEAIRLIRAHRLWETYLADSVGFDSSLIHEQAERLEHVLPEKLLLEVEKELGYPSIDPHGSPIPPRKQADVVFLSELKAGNVAVVVKEQTSQAALTLLFDLGLGAGSQFSVLNISESKIQLSTSDKEMIDLSRNMAKHILCRKVYK